MKLKQADAPCSNERRDALSGLARACGDAHLAGVGELDGVANEVEEHLREALFVPVPTGTSVSPSSGGSR
jgi:hypothetical protein